jgi:hypothetical protein
VTDIHGEGDGLELSGRCPCYDCTCSCYVCFGLPGSDTLVFFRVLIVEFSHQSHIYGNGGCSASLDVACMAWLLLVAPTLLLVSKDVC